MTELSIQHLTAGYGDFGVLTDITLPSIRPRQIVGVLGPNATGKSTLLRALAGFLKCDGQVMIDGKDVSSMDHAERAQMIGYLPQALPQTSSLVAYEAVLSACRAVNPDLSVDEAEAAVERTFDHLDIRDLAFRALNKLSGGQRQMVGLAQVVVRNPRILLLDEPTSALDLRWQLGVFRIIRETLATSDGLCLIALHDINLAMRHCDAIMMLAHGEVYSFGPPAEAISSETLRKTYGIEGRVETCSEGYPFVITDGTLPSLTNSAT